jgi:hypothetical protein
VAAGGLSAVFALYDILTKIPELARFFNNTGNLSGIEAASKGMNLTGGVLKSGADLVKGAGDIYQQAVNFDPGKYAYFTDKLSTAPGAMQFGAGMMAVIGGGLQTVSAKLDMKKAANSQQHLDQAKMHLRKKKAEDKRENMLQDLTDDQKRQKMLQRKEMEALIKHREKVTENTKSSATVNMIGGIITMAGGVLTMTGLLAPLGGILSIAGSAINIFWGTISARTERNESIRDAVDDGLKLREAVHEVIKHFKIKNVNAELFLRLKDQVRQEALAELHYATYKTFYMDMCRKSASLLYNSVLVKPSVPGNAGYTKTNEYKMYYETLMSLGFKEIKRSTVSFVNNFPTAEMIYNKLSQGVA